MRRLPTLLPFAAAAVLGLSACGGSDGAEANPDGVGSSADQTAVRTVVERMQEATRRSDAAAFCRLFEPAELKEWLGGPRRCIEIFRPALRSTPDLDLRIESIEVEGNRATVKLNFGESRFQRAAGKWYIETPDLEALQPAQPE